MIRALWTAATGMSAQQTNIDIISNNLANVNTAGYKKSRADFQDIFYQILDPSGVSESQDAQVPTGISIGLGTQLAAVQKIYETGEIKSTENPLDLAIEGDGFFQVSMPDGSVAYTRDGSFKKDSQGRMVTSNGFALSPEITIPAEATSISVGSDGTVSITLPGDSTVQELGQIQLAKFLNPAGLTNLGRNLLGASAASGDPTIETPGQNGLGIIAQRYLEMSNVQVIEEMVNMITAQRAYEVNSKAIQTADNMLSIANNITQ